MIKGTTGRRETGGGIGKLFKKRMDQPPPPSALGNFILAATQYSASAPCSHSASNQIEAWH